MISSVGRDSGQTRRSLPASAAAGRWLAGMAQHSQALPSSVFIVALGSTAALRGAVDNAVNLAR